MNAYVKTTDDSITIEFFKFLNGEISVSDLESFIYHAIDLEKQMDTETYLELISIDFKDKFIITRLSDLIKERIIREGEFEAWKLRKVLNALITDSESLHIYLDKLYHLYCGVYQDTGKRKYQFKFLANLGLNYLYWIDEGYMRTNYGEHWKEEYDRSLQDLGFYHQQLKPFAEEILSALDNKQIVIQNDGNYQIADKLKSKLESDKVYLLKHKEKPTQ